MSSRQGSWSPIATEIQTSGSEYIIESLRLELIIMWLLMIPKSCYEKSSEVMLYISSSTPFRPRLTPSTFDADVSKEFGGLKSLTSDPRITAFHVVLPRALP